MINNPSRQLTEFLNFLDNSKSEYKYCFDAVNEQDKLTQDYLHSLELGELKCDERSKLATKLATNRQDRRYYKDRVEELEPIVNWMNVEANKKAINMLREALGQVRRQENYHKDRTYVPRVLKEKKDG